MAKITQLSGQAVVANNATRYVQLGSGIINITTSEAGAAKTRQRTAGILSNLAVNCIANSGDGTYTITSRKAAADANQTITVSIGGTGYFEDTTHTDTIGAAEDWDIKFVGNGTTGSATFRVVQTCFSATTNTNIRYFNTNISSAGIAETEYMNVMGQSINDTTEVGYKAKFQTGGTLKNLSVLASFNNMTGSTAFRTRINGANGTLVCSFSGSATGLVEDTTHTDTVAVNDYVNMSVTFPDAHDFQVDPMAVDFTTTTGQYMLIKANANDTRSSGAVLYVSLNCRNNASTETDIQAQMRIALTLSKYYFYATTNTQAGSTIFTLRKNAGNTTITVTVSAAATGEFSDTTHSVSVVASDLLNWLVDATGSASGSITYNYFALLADTSTLTTVTVTVTAKARIKISGNDKTVTAKSRIKNSGNDKTVTAKSRIKALGTTKTVTAKVRTKVLGNDKTIQAKGRIKQANLTKTVTAKARMKVLGNDKTVTTKGRIKKIDNTQTIQAKGRIKQAAVEKTVTAKGRIKQIDNTKTIQAKSRIKQADLTKTITAKVKIGQTFNNTIQAKSRIKNYIDRTVQARADIKQPDVTRTIQSKGRIKKIDNTQTITVKTRVKISGNDKSVQTKANIFGTTEKSVTAKARILEPGYVKTIDTKARIKIAGNDKTIQTKGRVKVLNLTKTIQALAKINKMVEKTIQAKVNIINVSNRTIQTKSRIKVVNITKTIRALSRILQANLTKTITAKAHIKNNITKTVTTKSRVKVAGIPYLISVKSRVKTSGNNKTIQARARIWMARLGVTYGNRSQAGFSVGKRAKLDSHRSQAGIIYGKRLVKNG